MTPRRSHVLISGVVGFVAWAYIIEWLPSLRWIPHAFFAGALVTFSAIGYLILTTSKGVRHGADKHVVRATRVRPAFAVGRAWEEGKATLKSRTEYRRPLIFPQAVEFSRAVDGMLDLLIRDYVTSWYSSITERPLFKNEIDRCIRSALLSLAARLATLDLVEIGVANLLPLITAHLRDFYDAERAVRGKDLGHSVTESEELNMAIAAKFNGGRLHSAAAAGNADSNAARQEHLRTLIVELLPSLLPQNMKSSPAVNVLTREIVTCAVLAPVVQLLVDPDTWNQMIVSLAGPMLQDRKAVRRVRAALDQNAPASPKAARKAQFPQLKPYDSERQFERFIRAIRHISSLREAKHFRSDIASQLHRDSKVDGQDAAYLGRLETGKRLLDQKAASLAADVSGKQPQVDNPKQSDPFQKWLATGDSSPLPPSQHKHVGQLLSPPESSSGGEAFSSKPRRLPMQVADSKRQELRRTVLSASNLKGHGGSKDMNPTARRSLDETASRPALFGDDANDDPMSSSLNSLPSYDSDTESAQQAQDEEKATNAIKSELDVIVANKDKKPLFPDEQPHEKRPPPRTLHTEGAPFSAQHTSVSQRPELFSSASDRGRPSIASLGLVGAPSSRGVFADDLFSEEAQKFAEDEREDSDASVSAEDEIREAAPGDLGLAEAIDALNADVEKLTAQRQIIDSLTAKAELTNNAAELRILRKSEQSLQREIKRKEMQREQYTVQESDNGLYGRAAVSIKSVMVGREEDGHEYALYVVQVERQAGESMGAATWAVSRRYSQFHDLHKRLRTRFPYVRELHFPRRQTLFTLQRDFVEKRRVTLERYLRSLLLVPAICRSRELRAFLSQNSILNNGDNGTQVDAKDFVTMIYNSVSDGMDFLGTIPVLDQLSVAGQNLISAASSQMTGAGGRPIESLDPASQDPTTAAEAEAELNAYEVKEAEPFVKPICDLFLETFELSKGRSWLRGRTVVLILHQLLGGTIERKVREFILSMTEDESLTHYVDLLKSIMWPAGTLRQAMPIRTAAEKAHTRKEAGLILSALLPDLAGSVVGKTNGQAASRKIMAASNNQRLK